jgi:integrase
MAQALFDVRDGPAKGPACPLRPVTTFAYRTGWRKAEVLGLTWDKLDRNEGTLETRETENSEGRTVNLVR